MVADLETVVTAPAISPIARMGVDQRLRNEAAAGALLDLFTIGWDVVLLDPTAP